MIEGLKPLIQAMKGHAPQDILRTMTQNMRINNPLITQLIGLAQQGKNTDMFNLATSYFNQNGINIDVRKEFQDFMSMLK